MSLASRITDAIDAIATALNARNAPGASDYEVWKAQGNTGTIDNYRASVLGADMDFATAFDTALGVNPGTTTATEARAGITQLATLAEAQAANQLKALSPGNLKGMLLAQTLPELNAKAALVPDGWVIALVQQDLGSSNGFLYRSLWGVISGIARPIIPMGFTLPAGVTYLNGLVGPGKTYANLVFEVGISRAMVNRSGTPAKDEWLYIGATTGFLLWQGQYTAWSFASTTTNRSSGGTSQTAGPTRITMQGEQVHLALACSSGANGVGQFGIFLQGNNEMLPLLSDAFIGGAINDASAGWVSAAFYISTQDASVRPLSRAVGANLDFGAHGSFRRAIPTV